MPVLPRTPPRPFDAGSPLEMRRVAVLLRSETVGITGATHLVQRFTRAEQVEVGVLTGSLAAAVLASVVLRLRNGAHRRIEKRESFDSDVHDVHDVRPGAEPRPPPDGRTAAAPGAARGRRSRRSPGPADVVLVAAGHALVTMGHGGAGGDADRLREEREVALRR